jgi:glycerol-3-phosphate cytidylyltransferase-like family protein
MSLIRGVLLAGKWRTKNELNAMSPEEQRNTLIVEMSKHSNQSVEHFQAFDNSELEGKGAVVVFLRENKIRDINALKSMSDEDQRNTLIVENQLFTNLSADNQRILDNIGLMKIALGQSNSFIRGVLLAGKWRTKNEVNMMSSEDQRNTLVIEMSKHSNQSAVHFQAFDDATLAGKGAVVVLLRESNIRDINALKNMSDEDHRNTLIVENQLFINRTASDLRSLTNMQLVLLALGMNIVKIDPKISLKAVQDQGRFLEVSGHKFSPENTVKLDYLFKFQGDGVNNSTSGTETATSDSEGSFVFNIKVTQGEFSSAQVKATDLNSTLATSASI